MRPYSPGGELNALASRLRAKLHPTSSSHRLGRGLPGYLILFAPHAFVPQRQYWPRRSPSPLMFLPISTHFTATPGIPPSSAVLQQASIHRHSQVEPRDFTSIFSNRLRTFRCITHPFATRHQGCPRAAVRLACVRHAASVQSEPGSNSSLGSCRELSLL